MNTKYNLWVLAICLTCLGTTSNFGQTYPVDWTVAGPSSWLLDDNWMTSDGFMATPTADVDEFANFTNGGVAVVDGPADDVVGLVLANGTVQIEQNGSLDVLGEITLGAAGTLSVGPGSLAAEDLSNNGRIELLSDAAQFQVRNDYTRMGTVALQIDSATSPKITVDGSATLAGVLEPSFGTGVSLAYGAKWDFLTADTLAVGNVRINSSETMPTGLALQITSDTNTASLEVKNVPVLEIDRATGSIDIRNIVGGPLEITGYTIGSQLGLLDATNWQSLESQQTDSWRQAPSSEFGISEVMLPFSSSTLAVGESLNIGSAYHGAGANPRQEDVQFLYSTPDGNVFPGHVTYSGPANDLVLRIDPETGEAAIQNLSKNSEPFIVTGYSVLSPDSELLVDGWIGLAESGEEGWVEANPVAHGLTELIPDSSLAIGRNTVIPIGAIVGAGTTPNLEFLYSIPNGDVLDGTIEFGPIGGAMLIGDCNLDGTLNGMDFDCVGTISERDAVLDALNSVPGDLDGNGSVNFADFLVLSGNFGASDVNYSGGNIDLMNGVDFADFLALSSNFGYVASGATSVPEPSTSMPLALSGLAIITSLRRRR